MLVLKYLLMIAGAVLFGSSGALVAYDIYLSTHLRKLLRRGEPRQPETAALSDTHGPLASVRWGLAQRLALAAVLPLLLALSIVVIPDGFA
jgi:hypothetical protein